MLDDVELTGGRYKKHGPFPGYDTLCKSLPLHLFVVGCVGKLIVMCFDKDIYILCTLGLTGKFQSRKGKHSGVTFKFGKISLYFDDQIHYGTLRVASFADLLSKVRTLGPDITVAGSVSMSYLSDCLNTHKKWEIAKLLMDQRCFAGIGNYLKAEILYAAGIAPHSHCGSICSSKFESLLENINTIAARHYGQILTGRREKLSVYGKRKDPSGCVVRKLKTSDGRTSHWVPDKQVLYREQMP